MLSARNLRCLLLLAGLFAVRPAGAQMPGAAPEPGTPPPPPTATPSAPTTEPAPATGGQGTQEAPLDLTSAPLVELEIECDGQPWGSIVLALTADRTRLTVRNFLRYVDEGFYNGTIFHRVLPDFVIQGGGYTSLTQRKTEGLRGTVANESRRALKNTRGTIALARKPRDAHSGRAQFFINVVDNPQLDYPQAGQAGHTVFGRVIQGMDVVDRIKNVPTSVSPEAQQRYERYLAAGQQVSQAEKSQPLNPPLIKSARRLDRAEYERRFGPISPPAQPDVPPPAVPDPTITPPQPAAPPEPPPDYDG